jgi:hypothetical protein
MDIMLDAAAYINVNDKLKNYMCMLLHDVVAQCNKYTIIKILNLGADIMVEDSKQCLPLEVAIANKNGKFLIKSCTVSTSYQRYFHSQSGIYTVNFSMTPLTTCQRWQ